MLKRIADVEGVLIVGMTAITAFMFAVAFTYPKLASEFPKLILGVTLAMLLYLLIGRLSGKIPPSKVKGMGKNGPELVAGVRSALLLLRGHGGAGLLADAVLLRRGPAAVGHGKPEGLAEGRDVWAGHRRRLLGSHDLCDADPHPARHAAVLQISHTATEGRS